jgi:methylated-DNA-protein-cysteine methyltransferase-like protein
MVSDYEDLKPETRAIIEEIKKIPYGRVSSYRDVAYRAGIINGARQVARVLHGLSERYELPWWRVVRAEGRIALIGEDRKEQIRRLRAEKITVSEAGKVLSLPEQEDFPDLLEE